MEFYNYAIFNSPATGHGSIANSPINSRLGIPVESEASNPPTLVIKYAVAVQRSKRTSACLSVFNENSLYSPNVTKTVSHQPQ